MIKGVLVAFGIMVILALIPIVHFVGIPFGPFIGGYFGISAAGSYPGPAAVKALVFGVLLGLLWLLATGVASAILTVTTDLNLILLWLGVAIFTLYTASMGALGALYAELRTGG